MILKNVFILFVVVIVYDIVEFFDIAELLHDLLNLKVLTMLLTITFAAFPDNIHDRISRIVTSGCFSIELM